MEKKKKVLLGITIGMVILFFILYWHTTAQKGVYFRENFLKQELVGDTKKYVGSYCSMPAKITVDGRFSSNQEVVVSVVIGDRYQKTYHIVLGEADSTGYYDISLMNGTNVVFEGMYGIGDLLIDKEGVPYLGDNYIQVTIDGFPNWSTFEVSEQEFIEYASGERITHKGEWVIFWIITLLGVSVYIIDLLFPLFFFNLKYVLNVDNPEPSDFYLVMQQFSWYVLPFVFMGFYIAGLIMRF